MNKELKYAIIATVVYIVIYIGSVVVLLKKYISNNPFWFSPIGCMLEMAAEDLSGHKKCLCPDNLNLNNCVSTNKTYINSPNECASCTVHIPPGVVAVQIILLVLFVILILFWINVFTKTVKF